MSTKFERPTFRRKANLSGAVLYEEISLWNTYAGIANLISVGGHGGAIIIVPSGTKLPLENLRVKYPVKSSRLQSAFIAHVNGRHRLIDLERFKPSRTSSGVRRLADRMLVRKCIFEETQTDIAEAVRWVAGLAGCDGAILITDDLRLLGFGTEIRAELSETANVFEVLDDLNLNLKSLDVEQFGMRHRSAVKLISQHPAFTALVVSQDGPVSAVWSQQRGDVYVSKNIDLAGLHTSA